MDLTNEAAHSPSKTGVNALTDGREETPITIVTADGDGKLSVAEAARALASARHRPRDQDEAAEPQQQSSAAASAASEGAGERDPIPASAGTGEDATPPGETERADPADPLPPIEPPRSWTKADKELFTSLPRETQQRIVERERSREGDFLRRQAETVEKLKQLGAREQAMDQARLQYETALPQLLLALNDQAGEFADIKTVGDVERMAREDWSRYQRWDLAQKRLAFVQQQMLDAQQRQVTEHQHHFGQFAKREDELFIDQVPEFGDPRKAAELQGTAVRVLKDLGFDDAELAASWQGLRGLSLRDHRMQLLVRDATLWRQAQQKARAAAAKPVPPVQRPGVSQPKGAAHDAVIQNLNRQLENASGVNALRAAAKLVAAKRAAR
jgi:hypothetical protein